MKEKRKKWRFLIITLITICAIAIIILIINNSKAIGNEGISKAEYESIKNGMTMTEVSQIINPENINNVLEEQISRIEEKSGTVIYKYKYKGEHKGYAVITYEYTFSDLWLGNGMKVILKEEFDLK